MSLPVLLILTRHYPPEVSGGARRPFLIANGLRDRGYRVVVASPVAPAGDTDWIPTPHPAAVRARDASADDPGKTEPGWKTRLRRLVRWPDNEIGWAGQAVRAVLSSDIRPDWVLTTSPPESVHSAGARLKAALGARWMLEMRDSWIDEPLRPELQSSGLRRRVEQGMAARWLTVCDARIAVSDYVEQEMRRIAPQASSPLSVIGHFADPSPAPFVYEGQGPHLLHSGSFSLSHVDRRLDHLLSAFRDLREKMPDVHLHLAGRLTAAERASLVACPVADAVTVHGEVPYGQARAMQAGADGLIVYQQGIDALPGKLGEYLECSAPILTVGEGRWKSRLGSVPHWPLENLAEALRAPARKPEGSLSKALDGYERVLQGQ